MERDERESEPGATTELAVDDSRGRLPDERSARRDQLPGLEPQRQITDWGRSERLDRIVDRTVYDFLYHYWFRVEVEAIGNVPAAGGALLVANHAGTIATDAAMVAKAIREEHARPRPLHLITSSPLRSLPGVGMLVTKLGGVGAHPANLHRLLFDEEQLALVFPEGVRGARKALAERYRLRPFTASAFMASAIRARVPVVPVAILGAEEAVPRVAALPGFGGRARIPLGTGVPLPAKFRIRFLEPVDVDALHPELINDPWAVEELQEEIRVLIAENLLELVAGRRSVWLG